MTRCAWSRTSTPEPSSRTSDGRESGDSRANAPHPGHFLDTMTGLVVGRRRESTARDGLAESSVIVGIHIRLARGEVRR